MKLDDVEQRFKLIDGLIKVSFKNDEVFMPGNENYYEWLSNIEIMKLLISVSEMIRIERVFVNTIAELESVPVDDRDDRELAVAVVREKLKHFVDTVLLHMIDYTLNSLREWQFKTERGKKFHRSVHKKLDALIEAYQDIYEL